MESIASILSSRILNKLTQHATPYTEQGFADAELPASLIHKIVTIGENRLKASLSEPESQWTDSESETMKKAWVAYLRQAKRELLIPADEIKHVIESAVMDLLMAYCKPREFVLERLFGEDSELTTTELGSRFDGLGENHYLGFALLRYMDKKGLERVSKERADELLLMVDRKITEHYNPSDWGQLLKPVFELGGGTVPVRLIRLFFEEKRPEFLSGTLDGNDDRELSPEELIEVLSSDEQVATDLPADHKNETDKHAALLSADQPRRESGETNISQGIDKADASAGSESIPEFNFVEPEDGEEDDTGEDQTLAGRFVFDEDDDSDDDEEAPMPWIADEGDDSEDDGDAPMPWISDEQEEDDEDQAAPMMPWIAEEEGDDSEDDDDDAPMMPWIADDEEQVDEEQAPPLPWIADDVEEDEDDDDAPMMPWIAEEEGDDSEDDDDDAPMMPWIADDVEEDDEEQAAPIQWFADDEDDDDNAPILWNADEQDEGDDEEETPLQWIADDVENSDDEESADPVHSDVYRKEEPEIQDGSETAESPFQDEESLATLFDHAASDEVDNTLDEGENTEAEKEEAAFLPDPDRVETEPEESDFTEVVDSEESKADTPMWKSFLSRDDADEEPFFTSKEQGKSDVSDDRENQSAYLNLFDESDSGSDLEWEPQVRKESDVDRLIVLLKRDEKRYLRKLFKNSRIAYEQALADLMVFDDWKSASGYLEREIFAKNQIDLSSETAVDFTDKLHSFFMKQKS